MCAWKALGRKLVFDSRFVKVHEDTVELENGKILNDFTVIEKPNIVVVVAINTKNELIVLDEYKHGAGKVLKTLPAGHLKAGEDPVEAARRELLEETGYGGGAFTFVQILHEYPSKDLHTVSVVLAREVEKVGGQDLEETESLTYAAVPLGDVKRDISKHLWQSSSMIAALTVSGVLG